MITTTALPRICAAHLCTITMDMANYLLAHRFFADFQERNTGRRHHDPKRPTKMVVLWHMLWMMDSLFTTILRWKSRAEVGLEKKQKTTRYAAASPRVCARVFAAGRARATSLHLHHHHRAPEKQKVYTRHHPRTAAVSCGGGLPHFLEREAPGWPYIQHTV